MKVLDAKGREITIGAPVRHGGVVVGITEPDVDYSDRAERAVMFGPYVTVMYQEGQERWPCTVKEFGDFDTLVCDDVELT